MENNGWVKCSDRLPSNAEYRTDKRPHIHCWVAIASKNGGHFVEHLAWNPYYLCWDGDDEDDISRFNALVQYWQPLIIPEPPKESK
jgi:hypothetical protein